MLVCYKCHSANSTKSSRVCQYGNVRGRAGSFDYDHEETKCSRCDIRTVNFLKFSGSASNCLPASHSVALVCAACRLVWLVSFATNNLLHAFCHYIKFAVDFPGKSKMLKLNFYFFIFFLCWHCQDLWEQAGPNVNALLVS